MSEHWRSSLFNEIINKLNYTSYLELGVSTGEYCWNSVICEKKVGVDSNPQTIKDGVVCALTDDFFSKLSKDEKFHLIFIDAKHEKNQVLKDFCNSLEHLSSNGIIIMHDIYPLDESHIDIEKSCGNVYEFWIELVNNYPNETFVFEGYPGHVEGSVGIYFNFENNFDVKKIKDNFSHSYNYFVENSDKYVKSKILTKDEIILKCKSKL
jgi:hypothetical protein